LLKRDYNYKRKVKRLLDRFGIVPKDYNVYFAAFTHPSAAEYPYQSYETLEFLGDSVILVYVVHSLVLKFPHGRVGLLSKAKSQIVSGDSLAHIALELGLDKYVHADEALVKQGKGISNSVMADIFEAFTGAIFLDQGMGKVRKFLGEILDDMINIDLQQRRSEDFKSILQEEIQRRYKKIPCYLLTMTKGPDHDKIFFVRASFEGVHMGRGKGRSKKEAEQEAAEKSIEKLDKYCKLIDEIIEHQN
jgi:ribonuclease-3